MGEAALPTMGCSCTRTHANILRLIGGTLLVGGLFVVLMMFNEHGADTVQPPAAAAHAPVKVASHQQAEEIEAMKKVEKLAKDAGYDPAAVMEEMQFQEQQAQVNAAAESATKTAMRDASLVLHEEEFEEQEAERQALAKQSRGAAEMALTELTDSVLDISKLGKAKKSHK